MSAPRTAPRVAPQSAPESVARAETRAAEIPPPSAPVPPSAPSAPAETATDVVRWAAFSCVLVPVVLVWYGTSLAGATGAALGLAAVTGVCRVLLRQSERGAARAARSMAEDRTPRHGRRGRSASGAHRGGRNSGPSTPVD